MSALVPVNTRQAIPYAQDLNGWTQDGGPGFPYDTNLSFLPLIKFWESRIENEQSPEFFLAREIVSRVENIPVLKEPIIDISLLENYQEEIELLMLAIYPPAIKNDIMGAASIPFSSDRFYRTPLYKEIIQGENKKITISQPIEMVKVINALHACIFILNKIYDQEIELPILYNYTVTDERTGLQKHYRLNFNTEYIEIIPRGTPSELTQDQICHLLQNLYNLDLWTEYISPQNFEFQGIGFITLTDITEEESLNRIKKLLFEKDAVLSEKKVETLQQEMRNLYSEKDLRLGITGIQVDAEGVLRFEQKFWNSLIPFNEKWLHQNHDTSVYTRMFSEGRIMIVSDLKQYDIPTFCEASLLSEGIENILVAPLYDDKRNLLGLMELASPESGKLNQMTAARLEKMLPMFALALQRAKQSVAHDVEALIKEKCTAIHPSVEWRFVQAAQNLLEKREKNPGYREMEDIVFKEVYPLFGQAEIVGLSSFKDQAIQTDLIENLNLARRVIAKVEDKSGYPLMTEYEYELQQLVGEIRESVGESDEVRIMNFLRQEIDPLFEHLMSQHPELHEGINTYRNRLDSELGVIYSRRRDLEKSIAYINEAIIAHIESQQLIAQRILPHYFEKSHSNGVAFDIYMGQSFLQNRKFDQMHLKNMQLWQLIVMCEITRKVAQLQPKLKVPLSTSQLILVDSNPLSIRFKSASKRFEIEGANNVRYHIVKNNIDQAKIYAKGDKLSQPGKIAVICSQGKERQQYLAYSRYLKHHGYIDPTIEELELEPLGGNQSLHALRFTVAREKIVTKFQDEDLTDFLLEAD